MRILYIDQYFATRSESTGTRGYEFSRRLSNKGRRVTVITSASEYGPFAKQKRLLEKREIEGVRVLSLRIGYSRHMGIVGRVASFLGFMFAATFVAIAQKRHDVIFATSTPLSVGFPALITSLVRGTPFVFEVRDLWPRAPIELGAVRNRFVIGLLRFFERSIYKRATAVVALSPGIAAGVASAGADPEKITMIPNAADMDFADELPDKATLRNQLGFDDSFTLVYAGAIGRANDLSYLVDVLAEYEKAPGKPVRTLIIGQGADLQNVKNRIAEKQLGSVEILEPKSRAEAVRYLAAADLAPVLFKNLPVLSTNSPNKFFDALSVKTPCAVNTDGWLKELVEQNECGIFWPPDDPASAADSLRRLVDNPGILKKMSKNAFRLAKENFERGLLCGQLEKVLEESSDKRFAGLEHAIKRLFDLAASGIGLIVLSPLVLLICAAIRRDSPGPLFFSQMRAGRFGRPFRMFKFRTMVDRASTMGQGLNIEMDDRRITRVGAFLRRWSLDEMPQLFNIILGDMSISGPRPMLPEQAEMLDDRQRTRLRARPGITGLAQVSGRNRLSWKKRIEKDVEYVNDYSLWLDLKIYAKTLGAIISKEGLYEPEAGKKDDFNRFDQ